MTSSRDAVQVLVQHELAMINSTQEGWSIHPIIRSAAAWGNQNAALPAAARFSVYLHDRVELLRDAEQDEAGPTARRNSGESHHPAMVKSQRQLLALIDPNKRLVTKLQAITPTGSWSFSPETDSLTCVGRSAPSFTSAAPLFLHLQLDNTTSKVRQCAVLAILSLVPT